MLASVDPDSLSSMQNAVEHYGRKTDSELMEELRSFRAQGVFDDAALRDVAARLAPMLTDAQRQRLFSVMEEL
ncbi:MAG: hypothetical protein IJO10_09155 [Clostridia bacterium]|nr:hypothetical protein [Clostridia bacterium]